MIYFSASCFYLYIFLAHLYALDKYRKINIEMHSTGGSLMSQHQCSRAACLRRCEILSLTSAKEICIQFPKSLSPH